MARPGTRKSVSGVNEMEVKTVIARIEGLLSALVKLQMAPVLEHELADGFARRLWDLTGSGTIREIQKRLRCSPNRISDKWARWERSGLIRRNGNGYQRIM